MKTSIVAVSGIPHVKTKVQALAEMFLFHHHTSDTNFRAAEDGNS